MLPSLRIEKCIFIQLIEKCLNLCLTVFDNLDLLGCDKLPQPHKAVDGGIHRKEIGINDRHRNFADMRSRSPSVECGLRISKVRLWKTRLPFKDWVDIHRPQIRLAN